MITIKQLISRAMCIGLIAFCSGTNAQGWPTKPVTIVVPFAAGGPTDFIARLLAEPLSKELGQPVVISNRAGASGTIGVQSVKDSTPDGYTLVHTTIAAQALNPILYSDWKVMPQKDLVVVGTTATLPNVLVVSPKLGMTKFSELVDLARKKTEGLSYATFGVGTSPHILGMLFQKAANVKAVSVPYKGSAPALIDVMAGVVDFSFDNITTSAPQVKAGKVTALAIASPNRSSMLPDVPTLAELGYKGFDLSFGFSLSAPTGVPAEALDKLQSAFQKISRSEEYAQNLRARGAEPLLVGTADLTAFIKNADQRWIQVADELGLKGDRK